MGKSSFYCALDIAANKTSGVLAQANSRADIVDCYCESAPSKGVKNGRIADLGEASETVSTVINKLQAASGAKVKFVYTSMRGPHITCRHSGAVVPISERANKIITTKDIAKVNELAYSLGVNIEEEVLHRVPQWYLIDGVNKVLNPEGLYGRKLEADVLLVASPSLELESRVSAIDRAGFHTSGIILSGIASSLAVLGNTEKKNGCVFIDIGFESTQLLVFKDGIIRGLELFNFGSYFLDKTLSDELKVPYELAREIRVSHAQASSEGVDPAQEVLVKKDASYRPLNRKAICAVVEKRLGEIFAELKEKFARSFRQDDFPEGIIACGEVVLMEGFLESLEAQMGLRARPAKMDKVARKDLAFVVPTGLIMHALSIRPQLNILKMSTSGGIIRKIVHKSKELYQEYF